MTAFRHRITGKFVGVGFAEKNPDMVIPPYEEPAAASGGGIRPPEEQSMSDAKQISVESTDGLTRLVIRDRVTISQATELQEAALKVAAEPCDAVLDCSELTHLDSAAVQVLVALRNEFANSSTSMEIQGLDPALQRYLEGTGLWARLVN